MSDGEDEEIHGWVCLKTEDGKPYYYNPDLNQTQWDPPEEGFITLDDDDDDEVEEVEELEEVEEVEMPAASAEPYVDPSAGYDDAAAAPAAAPAIPRTPSMRRVCRSELKKTASFGAGQGVDAGDVYYLNRETGETVWETPDDYFDDAATSNKREVVSLAPITEDTTLADGFDVLDIFGEEAQYQVEAMKGGESDGEECLKRLNYLDELFQKVGEEEEWIDSIMDEEYALAATVYDYLSAQSPPDVRMVVCRLLVRMSKLDEQIGVHIVTERWGELAFLLGQVSVGIQHALAMPEGGDAEEEERMQALFAWFLLISQMFTSTQDYGLPYEVMPQATFFAPIIQAMEDCTEMVFLAACEACLAINYHYESRGSNQFMSALMGAEEVSCGRVDDRG